MSTGQLPPLRVWGVKPPALPVPLPVSPKPSPKFPFDGGFAGRIPLPESVPELDDPADDPADDPEAGVPDARPSFSAITVVSATTAPAETAAATIRPRRQLPRGRRAGSGAAGPPDGSTVDMVACSCSLLPDGNACRFATTSSVYGFPL
ncbi:MAG TPA: hypothetical protein VFC99_15410 [Acidimicrobiia bacterium]|nr:hypothetical protein [Acidimicrobiia bacterium]